ncbi:MFS transporter [Pseudomonas sp. 102515]|nr:MFS transporter [Pseudomonas sp. 102515]MDQ7915578.1 MFS transporter [Pseudomonas sp. 102515]
MTLAVFALIASEFLPVSLLTPLAADLGVSEGLAGYGIAVSGACAVVTSLSITRLVGRLDRKILLLSLTALMGFSGMVVALAGNYPTYLLGRALIGVVIGGFWSMSAAVAMRLVPENEVPKALAIFNGGNALATVIAAPLGSYLGGVIGWRGAFFCLVPIALLAFSWQWLGLPALPANGNSRGATSAPGLLRRPLVAMGMLAVGLFFMGQFSLFTYVRPFLEMVTGLGVTSLSLALLALGLAGFVGTLLIGGLIRRGLYTTLTVIPLLMAVLGVALVVCGSSAPLVLGVLSLWGLVATAAPVGWWAWLARSLPADAEAGGGLMVAVVQLSIALGSILGGLLYDGLGYQATFLTAALLLVMAVGLTLATARLAGRTPA